MRYLRIVICGMLVAQASMLKAQNEPPEFPVALEGFGFLDPPYFVGEDKKVGSVQSCDDALKAGDSSLCAAEYSALLFDDAILITAFGAHKARGLNVTMCQLKSQDGTPSLELRHSIARDASSRDDFFLRVFIMEGIKQSPPKVVRIRDAMGDHSIQVKEAPKHSDKTPQ